ncbi:MAG: hypothetical protein JW741_19195, partial [Sedimentisphaerales bacterium]|nr:hypothetical protein [Sedimentisphaerales bacterium]
GDETQASRRFHKLVDYGETHLFDKVEIDYFAVSLPDFLVFDEDLQRRNEVHCRFMRGLGLLGLGRREQAGGEFSRVRKLDPAHVGAALHRRWMGQAWLMGPAPVGAGEASGAR